MTKKIIIEGMSCGHCSGHVTRALKELKGVIEATVDLKDKSALVQLDNNVDDGQLKAAVEDAGYEVVAIEVMN